MGEREGGIRLPVFFQLMFALSCLRRSWARVRNVKSENGTRGLCGVHDCIELGDCMVVLVEPAVQLY